MMFFQANRFLRLIVNELKQNKKIILISFLSLLLFFLILPFGQNASLAAYPFFLYAGGFIITSHAFKDLHDPSRAYAFLMLPCSNLERFLSKWCLTSVIYAISLLLMCYIISTLSALITFFVHHVSFDIINIFQPDFLWMIGKYIIFQSVILLGAISFKQYALIKTGLTVLILFFLFSLFLMTASFFFCPHCLPAVFIVHATFHGMYFIFWLLLVPFCWYFTYQKLADYELR